MEDVRFLMIPIWVSIRDWGVDGIGVVFRSRCTLVHGLWCHVGMLVGLWGVMVVPGQLDLGPVYTWVPIEGRPELSTRIASFSQIGPKGFILGPIPSITISYMAAYVAVFWRQIFGPKWYNGGKVFRSPKMKLGPDCTPPLDPSNPHRPSMNSKSTSTLPAFLR